MSLSTTSYSPLISVVAPVYKVEPFLQECIDSILNQSFKDFELILVDDGSPDKCGEICDKAAEKDTRIRVFHQENGGVSSARKLGVDNAKGEWICFVDPDDRLPVDSLKDLITACDTLGYNLEDFDIIEGVLQGFKVNERNGKETPLLDLKCNILQKETGCLVAMGFEYDKHIVYHDLSFSESPCKKIIRRSLLIETDALNIPREHVRGEDTMMDLKLGTKVRKALRISNVVYEYRMNPYGTCSANKHTFHTFARQVFWWNAVKEILKDIPEYGEDFYKAFITRKFYVHFGADKGKSWHLRSPEFAPFLTVINEKKDLLPIKAKIYLLSIRFPFTLIPERLFFLIIFGINFIVKLPFRVVRKLLKIIKRK